MAFGGSCVNKSGRSWFDCEVNSFTDFNSFVNFDCVTEFSSSLSGCLDVLAGNVESVADNLIFQLILTLERITLTAVLEHLNTINLYLLAARRSLCCTEDHPVAAFFGDKSWSTKF